MICLPQEQLMTKWQAFPAFTKKENPPTLTFKSVKIESRVVKNTWSPWVTWGGLLGVSLIALAFFSGSEEVVEEVIEEIKEEALPEIKSTYETYWEYLPEITTDRLINTTSWIFNGVVVYGVYKSICNSGQWSMVRNAFTTRGGRLNLWNGFIEKISLVALGILTNNLYYHVFSSMTYLNYFSPRPYFRGFKLGDFSWGKHSVGKIEFEGLELPGIEHDSFMKDVMEMIEDLGEASAKAMDKMAVPIIKTCLGLAALHISKLMLQSHLLHRKDKPALTRKFHFDDLSARLYNHMVAPWRAIKNWTYPVEEKKRIDPIFEENLANRILELSQALVHVHESKGTFINALFYGPPGTGKTMTAEYMAKNLGFNYVEFSGGDVAKFLNTKHPPLVQMDAIWKRIDNSKTPTIVFIDEIDAIGANRSRLDPARIEILNALLNQTGAPSKKLILIGATNNPEVLDTALLSRFDEQIFMGAPSQEALLELLKVYACEYFSDEQDLKLFQGSFLEKWVNLFKGEVPRTIQKAMNKCAQRKKILRLDQLNEKMVEETFVTFLKNRHQLSAH